MGLSALSDWKLAESSAEESTRGEVGRRVGEGPLRKCRAKAKLQCHFPAHELEYAGPGLPGLQGDPIPPLYLLHTRPDLPQNEKSLHRSYAGALVSKPVSIKQFEWNVYILPWRQGGRK